jgi:RHS repeat-associated protein
MSFKRQMPWAIMCLSLMNKILSYSFIFLTFLWGGIENAHATAPSFTTQPSNKTVTVPATATFTVAASGSPTPTYQWQQKAPGGSFTSISGATSTSYTTPATTAANNGTQYECVATNSAGSATSNLATLTVNYSPSITTQPSNATVTAPATATFTVAASGNPTPTYQWKQKVPGGSFTSISGATSASYTTPATTLANSGTQYECVVTNSIGNVTSNVATLTVNVTPSITTQPSNATVTAPATATFTVAASGTPTPTYQWQQEASGAGSYTAISGATSASYTTPATTAANDGTKYECVATNSAGSATSNAATLTVKYTPIITTQPSNTAVTVGTTATFSVVAVSDPAPTYQWNQKVPGGSFTSISGATSASYTTPATTTSNDGTQYECVVTNSIGNVTSNAATLNVNVPPTITTQPTYSTTVTAPATATFTVTATGTPSPTYQWFVTPFNSDQTAISGATQASYTTPSTTTPNNGSSYVCKVTNVAGSVTSSAAYLYVNPSSPPVVSITAPANNSRFMSGSSVTLTATASETNGAIYAVQFYNGPTLLGTSYSAPYSVTVSNISTGYYNLTAVATDISSVSATSSSIVVIGVQPNVPPVVNIVNPANQGTFTTGSLKITAIATEGDGGTIANVSFYNGATLLGTVASTSQAYTYPWTNIPAGTYTLTAVATDIFGTQTTSSPITITINSLSFTYGVDDNTATQTDALGHTTSYQYDNLNRLIHTTFADSSTVSFAHDSFGNQTGITDQRGHTLTKSYDAYDRLTQLTDPNGGVTQFSYDTNGRLLTLTDANGHPTTYTYDADGKVLTQSNALNLATSYTYDAAGNVLSRTDANSKTTNYTYDALNRLTNTAYPGGSSVANVYDALGRRTSMTDSTGQTTYSYDALDRLLSKTSPGANSTISYTYDTEGNRLTSIDQSNRTISNTYDALNRLSSVTDPYGTTYYAFDAVSNEISTSNPNAMTESYTYDALNRPLTAVNSTGATVISSFTNVYDIAGMITKKTYQDGSWTAYSYDALNQLLEETRQTSSSIIYDYVYTYDAVGNRSMWTKNSTLGGFWNVDSLVMPPQVLTNMTNAGYGNTANPSQTTTLVRSYTNDAANRLTSWNYAVNVGSSNFPVQTDGYTYDNNGNRLTKQAVLTGQESTPQQTSYAYDFENFLNQLNYVNIPGITGTQTDGLTYNGEGLRTQAVRNGATSNYFYDGFNVLVEKDGSGITTKSYTRGLDSGGGIGSLINQNYTVNNTAVTQYFDYNDLGSTADTTTATGTSASSYSYDAFGNLLAAQTNGDTNRYLFSTKEFDSRSGLYYFGARYYDPEVGRWLNTDPLGYTDGFNLYAYVNNNPLNAVDPFGFQEYALPRFGDGDMSPIGNPSGPTPVYNGGERTPDGPSPAPTPQPSPPPNKKDPCKGLRDELAEHEQKLADFIADPCKYDNNCFLGKGYDQQVIAGRIKRLKRQIENFRKQVEECEAKNGL